MEETYLFGMVLAPEGDLRANKRKKNRKEREKERKKEKEREREREGKEIIVLLQIAQDRI